MTSSLFSRTSKTQTAHKQFRAALLCWYDANKRDLPWRRTRNPFHIWVSEIMLQQTRVAAVLEHYKRFFQQFPTVAALARAREQQVLTAWSGLGYYRRARMLQRAAREIVQRHSGRIPNSSARLQELPGIGRYTAAAIASIAFEEPVAVVDGNVERVLSRLAGRELTTSVYWSKAQELIDPERPGDFNQAIMELGATVCMPRSPWCDGCPVIRYCATRGAIAGKKPRIRQKQMQQNLGFATDNDAILLQQRSGKESVMPGMWELPEYTGKRRKPLFRVKHSIMNTDYEGQIFSASGSTPAPPAKWVKISRLGSIPLTGMSRKVLRQLSLLQ